LLFDFFFSCHAPHNLFPSLVALLAVRPQALPQIKSIFQSKKPNKNEKAVPMLVPWLGMRPKFR
jgi:hypothetical protein